MNTIADLRHEISRLENTLRLKRDKLQILINQCEHCWGMPIYDPIKVDASMFPGDIIGGVDRRPMMHIPEQITKRWTRTCLNCGYTQVTNECKHGPDVPIFK